MARSNGITAQGVTAMSGGRYLLIKYRESERWCPHRLFPGTANAAVQHLADRGMVLTGKGVVEELAAAVSGVPDFLDAPLLEQSGWSGCYFALPDGSVFKPEHSSPATAIFNVSPRKCVETGTLKGWRKGVATPLNGQPIPMFALMLAFMAPLLGLVRRLGNVGFELVGRGGTGKSTVQLLAASVIGGIHAADGGAYWITFDQTLNALEGQMADHADLLMVIEEANLLLAGESVAKRAAAFKALAFRMSGGKDKGRYGAPSQRDYRFTYLSSTNEPLAELIGSNSDVARAAGDRLITLQVKPDHPYGVFRSVPEGYLDASSYANALVAAAAEHHGTAFRHFIAWLVEQRANDETALLARIVEMMSIFRRKAKVDPNNGSAVRVADAFGLVYAAGRLAQESGALPAEWKPGSAVLSCYNDHRLIITQGKTLVERMVELAGDDDTLDLDAEKVSREDIAGASVFVRLKKGRELLIRPDAIDRIWPDWPALRRREDVRAILKRDGKHLTGKCRLNFGPQVRMHIFRLPPEANA